MKYSKGRQTKRPKKGFGKRPKQFYGRLRRDLPKVCSKQPVKYVQNSFQENLGYSTIRADGTSSVRENIASTQPAYFIQNLTAIAHGTDYITRQGQRIKIKDVTIRGSVGPAAPASQCVVRAVLIQDKFPNQPVGGLGAIDPFDIFTRQAGHNDDTIGNPAVWLPNPVNRKRFKILSDKVHYFETASNETSENPDFERSKSKSFYLKKKLDIFCDYNTDTTATSKDLAQQNTNALYFMLIPYQKVDQDNQVVFAMQSHVNFVDA